MKHIKLFEAQKLSSDKFFVKTKKEYGYVTVYPDYWNNFPIQFCYHRENYNDSTKCDVFEKEILSLYDKCFISYMFTREHAEEILKRVKNLSKKVVEYDARKYNL